MTIAANVPKGDGEGEKAPWSREIPDHKQVFVGELAERGEWVVANIETTSSWPINSQKVVWRGHAFWIIPLMKGFYPAVAMKVPPGKHRSECAELLMRFVSNLSWVEDAGFMVDGIGGGNLPRPMGRNEQIGFSIRDEFDLSYFPEPASKEALLALALMREGRGLNHAAYAFLSFFRVLEVAFPNGRQRKGWLEANVGTVKGHLIKGALDELQKKGITDIATHLFESGRCAVAHASEEPIVDPDRPEDMRRLSSELPIIRALAERAIESQLGVETSQTVWRKHLYELAGFKEILGPELVELLTRGVEVTEERTLEIPDISVRIRRRDPYAALEQLTIKQLGHMGKLLYMHFEAKEGDVAFRFALDFGNERLEFSLFRDLAVQDLGSADSADRVAEIERFHNEYFGNGQLQIFNAETGSLIARKDAYIPVNMYLNHEKANASVARWQALARERRERDRKFAEAMSREGLRYDVKFSTPP